MPWGTRTYSKGMLVPARSIPTPWAFPVDPSDAPRSVPWFSASGRGSLGPSGAYLSSRLSMEAIPFHRRCFLLISNSRHEA